MDCTYQLLQDQYDNYPKKKKKKKRKKDQYDRKVDVHA